MHRDPALAELCTTAPENLTVAAAPTVMQAHLTCDTSTCVPRRTALSLLVADGQYVLAANTTRERA